MPDDPDKRRPGSHWGDDERVDVGARHRASAPVHGVPIDQIRDLAEAVGGEPESSDEDDVTGPLDMRELGPLTPREAELWDSFTKFKLATRQRAKKTSDQIVQAMGDRPPNERLTALETRMKILYAVLAALASLALGEAITVAKGIYERGQNDGAALIRTQDLERRVDSLEHLLTPDRFLRNFIKGTTP